MVQWIQWNNINDLAVLLGGTMVVQWVLWNNINDLAMLLGGTMVVQWVLWNNINDLADLGSILNGRHHSRYSKYMRRTAIVSLVSCDGVHLGSILNDA